MPRCPTCDSPIPLGALLGSMFTCKRCGTWSSIHRPFLLVTVPLFLGVFFLFYRDQPASELVFALVLVGMALGMLRVRVEAVSEAQAERDERLKHSSATWPPWTLAAVFGGLMFLALFALWLNAQR